MAEVLPAALGVAASPVPIVAVILLLGRPLARGPGRAFALGWVVALAVLTAILVASAGEEGTTTTSGPFGPGPQVVVGAALVALAGWQWLSRPRAGESPLPARWLEVVDRLGVVRSTALGIALCCVNPKNLALTAAVGSSIGHSGRGGVGTLALAVVFVVVGSASVAGPALWYSLAPGRATRPLQALRRLLDAHGAAVTVAVAALVGARLLGEGIGGL